MTIKGTSDSDSNNGNTRAASYEAATTGTDEGKAAADAAAELANLRALTGSNTITVADPGTASSSVTMAPNSYASTTSTIKVYTNNLGGYTLSVAKASGETGNLSANNGDDTITPGTVTANVGGGGHWALSTDSGETFTALDTTTGNTIKSNGTRVTGGDTTIVTYGISTSPTQGTGNYTTKLTYTATTNNS